MLVELINGDEVLSVNVLSKRPPSTERLVANERFQLCANHVELGSARADIPSRNFHLHLHVSPSSTGNYSMLIKAPHVVGTGVAN